VNHPAVFMDRDGTLSEEIGYMTDPSKLVLIQGAAEALKRLADAGFRLVVVTNQSGVSRGYFGLKDLLLANERLERLFLSMASRSMGSMPVRMSLRLVVRAESPCPRS